MYLAIYHNKLLNGYSAVKYLDGVTMSQSADYKVMCRQEKLNIVQHYSTGM